MNNNVTEARFASEHTGARRASVRLSDDDEAVIAKTVTHLARIAVRCSPAQRVSRYAATPETSSATGLFLAGSTASRASNLQWHGYCEDVRR